MGICWKGAQEELELLVQPCKEQGLPLSHSHPTCGECPADPSVSISKHPFAQHLHNWMLLGHMDTHTHPCAALASAVTLRHPFRKGLDMRDQTFLLPWCDKNQKQRQPFPNALGRYSQASPKALELQAG